MIESTDARHSSESNEHFTPPAIVDAARALLGGIDLDPASCEAANRTVKAERIFTKQDNGFAREWNGRVFLNPPGGFCDSTGALVIKKATKKGVVIPACSETGACGIPAPHMHDACLSSQKEWWFRLANAYARGVVTSAVFICFSVELLQTTQVDTPVSLSIPLDHPKCFASHRVAYVRADGSIGASPPHSSCIIYLPPKSLDPPQAMSLFKSHFDWLGACR